MGKLRYFHGVKRPGREIDHSTRGISDVKNTGRIQTNGALTKVNKKCISLPA
jgi:hypothetical protein